MTFYENYLRLCNKAGKSPSAVAIEAKVGKPAVSRWKAGTKPRDATITKLAAYFNVPVSELKGEADDPGIKKDHPERVVIPVTDEQWEAWEIIKQLDNDTLKRFIVAAKAFLPSK